MGSLVGRAHEVVQVGSFGVVELQGTADAFEYGFGDPGGVAALEADVVLDAHSRDEGDFLAAQPGTRRRPP